MSILKGGLHAHTPTLAVVDPRGLDIRSVAYCRPVEAVAAEERINRSTYDAMGRLISQWDPRLWALRAQDVATPANLINRYSLSNKALNSISVDAGERISLFGDGDQLVQTWDSRDTGRRIEYDDLLRPLAFFEHGKNETARCTERYEYASADDDFAAHNQCGQLIRHDDPAGTQTLDEYALTGGVLQQTQRFLQSLDSPDWPPALPERDALLEPMTEPATSTTRFNPLGDVLEQTDAKGNRQRFDYTFDGQLLASRLQLNGQPIPQTLVSDIAYNAYGQIERETAGNGVVTTCRYRAEDGRLMRLEALHGTQPLQDLHYDYDPVGNVLSIRDDALPIRYFANQQIEPINRYGYDSLYQLIKATGWEAGRASRGPQFNRFDDPAAVANYQQTYHYDAGGNLLELTHIGPQNHSRKLAAARYSNRCLPYHDQPPDDGQIAAAFDGNGNLLVLQPGQRMSWDLRNQLREVQPVEHEDDRDDRELYVYGGDGMRRRKIRSTHTNARSLISEVRYLPSLEIRSHQGTGEVLQVICVQAGRSAMQVLHWETQPCADIPNDQYRYNLTDHLGSSSLELDSEAGVISQETYHPYGSTAWFAGRSEVESNYKTVRYSGKERDATGLYYYGSRYYIPWRQRWVNPDPAGAVDGLNLFRMLRNCPLSYKDDSGGNSFQVTADNRFDVLNESETRAMNEGVVFNARGLEHFPAAARQKIDAAFTEAELWLGEATKALSSSPLSESTKILLGKTFGVDFLADEKGTDKIRIVWHEKLNDLSNYLQDLKGSNSWRLGLVQFERATVQGRTSFNATQGHNIWLSSNQIEEKSHTFKVAEILVHEASHAMYADMQLRVWDFWYLPSTNIPATATSGLIDSYVQLTLSMSESFSRKGPEEGPMKPILLKLYGAIINTALKPIGQSATSPSERREAFVENSSARINVIMRNADSYRGFLINFRQKN